MRFADRVGRLRGESAFDVLSRVRAMEARGRSIVSFAIGEPDFDTPEPIKEAGIRAIREGKTGYAPSAGIEPLRRAAANFFTRTRRVPVEPDEVVVAPGGKPILFYTLLCCVDPGDEVLTPNPGFPTYDSLIRYLGATPVPIPLTEERNFRFDASALERLVTPRTRMIILNSPHNPTGGMLTGEDLEGVARLARERDLWVLSDEIYSALVYGPEIFRSVVALPGMKERTVVLDGCSKAYAMTGWRLGFGLMPRDLVPHVVRLLTNSNSCTALFTQYAGIAALEGSQEPTRRMVAEYALRRDLLCEGLNRIPGFRCVLPKGAFYAYANVTGACRRLGLSDDAALQDLLLEKAGVAVLTRSCFGDRNPGEDQDYLRFCFAASREKIREGLARIGALLAG
jgi:aspartate/methionine/tyrosine aminotransferase